MMTRTVLALSLFVAPSLALASPQGSAAEEVHPVVTQARSVRAQLRHDFDRLRLEREVARAHATALSARTERTAVEVVVPTTRVARPDLALSVRCPPQAPAAGESLACRVLFVDQTEIVAAKPAPAQEASTPTGAYTTPATLD